MVSATPGVEVSAVSMPAGSFAGETGRRRQASGLTLVESRYHPGLSTHRHFHERDCFCLVLHGGFQETYGSRRWCATHDLLFRPAGEDHSNQYAVATRCLNVEMDPAWSLRLREVSGSQISSTEIARSRAGALGAKLQREFGAADAASALAIESLVLEMVSCLARQSELLEGRRSPRWLELARQVIHDDDSLGLSLSAIAAHVGVHPVHLARSFRKRHGCTVGEYLRRLRLTRACELLHSSSLPLADIALASGFAHQSHFSNAFRGALGMTPAQYRKSVAGVVRVTRGARRSDRS